VRALLIGVGLLALSSPAAADFTADQRQSDFSAFNMNQNELRLGLFQEEYAIFNQWAVGTYLAPWIVMPIAQGPILNLYTKVEILDFAPKAGQRFALATRATVLYADVDDLTINGVDEGQFKATILPLSIIGSYVFDDVWTASLEATFVQTWLNGDVDSAGAAEVAGAGAQRSFQIAGYGEMRLSHHVALNLVLRYAPWVEDLRVQSEVQVNSTTTTNLNASFDAPTSGTAWLIQPGVTCSWGHFNLQVGLGYGNLFLPSVRVVSSSQVVVPDLDVYFRF
jgi:hypothetical protein